MDQPLDEIYAEYGVYSDVDDADVEEEYRHSGEGSVLEEEEEEEEEEHDIGRAEEQDVARLKRIEEVQENFTRWLTTAPAKILLYDQQGNPREFPFENVLRVGVHRTGGGGNAAAALGGISQGEYTHKDALTSMFFTGLTNLQALITHLSIGLWCGYARSQGLENVREQLPLCIANLRCGEKRGRPVVNECANWSDVMKRERKLLRDKDRRRRQQLRAKQREREDVNNNLRREREARQQNLRRQFENPNRHEQPARRGVMRRAEEEESETSGEERPRRRRRILEGAGNNNNNNDNNNNNNNSDLDNDENGLNEYMHEDVYLDLGGVGHYVDQQPGEAEGQVLYCNL